MIATAPSRRPSTEPARARVARFAFLLFAVALAGCASGERPPGAANAAPQARWGDVTVAMTYKDGDPLVAYFSAGEGAGRISVWDGGEQSIVKGDWRIASGEICMTLNVFRRDRSPRPPLRGSEPICLDRGDSRFVARAYRGDVFALQAQTDAPYILSQADNERLVTVLHDAQAVGR